MQHLTFLQAGADGEVGIFHQPVAFLVLFVSGIAESKRVPFDLERIMRSQYKIDTYQATYFVIDSFDQLFQATAPDFTPIYERVRAQPEILAGDVLPHEVIVPV